MINNVGFFAAFNERTGFGNHATNFVRELEKIVPVKKNEEGDVNISLLDVVSASHVTIRRPYPSILWTVWESTEYPAEFMDKIKLYDQMWVVSEWERSCAIAQGIPEEFVKVVHEGVDTEIFKPRTLRSRDIDYFNFNFLHVGQWQPRKSTKEICESFIKAFPKNKNVYLFLSADTLFPSDTYKSTEERLLAYGLDDPRIIPIHFEERDQYIRRLQSANCFVSCSRAEGWGLPIIESMACGVPTIVADWSGSTEYAGDAILVNVPELKKPEGIYGNWDVPGKWGEPDYGDLVLKMKDAYKNYSEHKKKALKTSKYIRSEFSWQKAAQTAYEIIQSISEANSIVPVQITPVDSIIDADYDINLQDVQIAARRLGYELTPCKAIFFLDCWPDTNEKLITLQESIKQVHDLGYPVLVSSHYPLPVHIIELCDFYIYEQRDIMSGDDKPIYWRRKLDGKVEEKMCSKEYQGVAALNCARNAIDFCRGKYDWIYQMSADMEVDLNEWLSKVHESDKEIVLIPYEGNRNGMGGGLWAAKVELADKVFPYLNSWKEYADKYPDVRFVAERWLLNYITSIISPEDIGWIDVPTHNRFDNVDRDIWDDDEFQCHFIEGPMLNIVGISNREYDVTFSNPIDGSSYGLKQKPGVWSRPSIKYYREWTVEAKLNDELKFRHTIDLTNKRVIVSMGSKALGDTMAWIPYVEEFRKKHNCHVICSTWWNRIMDYPEIEFTTPGTMVPDLYASYELGCFDGQLDKNVHDWRTTPLQKVASDQLGLEYEPIRARLKYLPFDLISKRPGNKPYIIDRLVNHRTVSDILHEDVE